MTDPLKWFSADLIGILPAAVYVCDAQAVVVAYNHRAAELWGRAPKLGDTDLKFCGAHKLFLPDGTPLPQAETPMEWVLRTGEPARDKEVMIERPDGSRVLVLVNIAPILGTNGVLIGAVNCFQDLTARQKSENDQALLRAELHQSQKVQALGQLTGGIAHDFNNVIGEITLSLDLIKRQVEIGRDDGIERLLKSASESAHRASALTHRLLAFARQQPLDVKSTDVNALIIGIDDLLRRTIGEAIALEIDLNAGSWAVLTDASQLENALLNLVINARDAMPEGGRITIEAENMQLDEASARLHLDVPAGDYVMISVSDTGQGMSEAVVNQAFDPFFTTKPAGQGTGLGLSMIHGFVKQSGGHVRIYSEVGRGTVVKMYLRRGIALADLPAPILLSQDEMPVDHNKTILIVDDNAALLSAMKEAVTELGYTCLAAPDAKSAITLLNTPQRIDLLVTDVGLPIMNGRELVEIAQKIRQDLRVLFMTGYTAKAAIRGNLLPDGMEMMTKPFTIDVLADKLSELTDA